MPISPDGIYYQQDATKDCAKLAQLADVLRAAQSIAEELPEELLQPFGNITFVGDDKLTRHQIDTATVRAMRCSWEGALKNHGRHGS